MTPRTQPRYARSGEVHIAYQVVGDAPLDIVYTPGIWSNLDVMWEWAPWSRYLLRLASFARLVLFDMRGVGLSDRGPEPPTLEVQMSDLAVVMNTAGCGSAAILAGARGAAMAMLFAASFPERTRAPVLYAPIARSVRSPDWPYGRTEAEQQVFFDRFTAEMGTAANLDLQGPSGDDAFRRWWARFERLTATPGAWRELQEIMARLDVRSVLGQIQAPTLVLHRSGDRAVDVRQGRAVANAIPGATFVELPGNDHIPFLGDVDLLVDHVEEFLTGVRPAPLRDRMLATVLFTDIVGSTERAAAMGDRCWRELLTHHHRVVREALDRHRGREVGTAGDGIAVHLGARVAALAGAGEVLVSRTVVDLVAGSGLSFEDRGEHELKGVPGSWRLFAVEGRYGCRP